MPPPNGPKPRRAAAQGRDAVAQADIVVANLLFIEEHITAILPERCSAARDRLRCLRRRDRRSPDRQADQDGRSGHGQARLGHGADEEAARLRSAPQSGEKQMAMLRRLPKILRFIPGKAQDLRAWFLSMQYWLGGSDDNIER
jgi:magnesium chelatase subunit H